jgi:2-deoxy-D-gluconate 3-dehydrogenase
MGQSEVATPADLFDLTGKVALVTGARRGLGRAIALAFAGAGADIVGLGPREMPETAAAVTATGRRFAAISADLGEANDHTALAAQAAERFGRIDILVNNSGIIRRHALLDYPEADWDAVMAINLKSVFLLSQAVARLMAAAKQGGRIIHVGSILAFQGGVRVPAYAAAKHAVVGLTRAMANELAPMGITVNAIAPGYMATDNTEALRADPDRARAILDRIPAGRWGESADLATAALFLASPASSYVTGTVVTVDGGWLAR